MILNGTQILSANMGKDSFYAEVITSIRKACQAKRKKFKKIKKIFKNLKLF